MHIDAKAQDVPSNNSAKYEKLISSDFVRLIAEEDARRRQKQSLPENEETQLKKARIKELLNMKALFFTDGALRIDLSKISDKELHTYAESLEPHLPVWNTALLLGTLIYDSETMSFYTPELDERFIANLILNNKLTAILKNTSDKGLHFSALNNTKSNCYCYYTKLNATGIATQNYNTISNYYISMSQLPGADAWASTVGYWISFVQEGGAWDYKAHWGGITICFTIQGIYGYHYNPEWLGNYNYGFTGKFLFPLDILHAGSYAISGFQQSDIVTDWPAIDLGYSHAP